MKKSLSLILIFCIIFSSISNVFAKVFTDTDDSWAKKEIEAFTSYDILNGYDDETFRPNEYIKRAEIASII